MAKTVISVENLGKKYAIRHFQERYKTVRDSFATGVKNLFRRGDTPSETIQEFWALRGVNFAVDRGEIVGVIGRNGAGKSTLLKVLSRITEPTEGRALVHGQVGSLLEVGTGFHQELTGRENIYLSGAILGMKKAEIRRVFDEIVAFSEVETFLDTPVKRYSSGMYLRLAFAVAAHLQPDILFVDEVLAVGDATFQKKCIGKMSEVAQSGRTVVFVSHNMGVVSALCSRVILMANGSVAADGKAREVIQEMLPKQMAASTDLSRLRSRGMGEAVRFSSISLESHTGSTILFQTPLRFRLRIEASRRHQGLSIGASVFNALGVAVATLFTTETFDIEAGENLDLLLTVPSFNLSPDFYHAGFSIGSGGGATFRRDLDIVIGEPTFEISPVSGDESHLAQWQAAAWGNIVIAETSLEVLEKCV
jgi:lipopolysaccharide transport system ATP-binding protein